MLGKLIQDVAKCASWVGPECTPIMERRQNSEGKQKEV